MLRAWDPARPVLACPAMNTNMWMHPFTAKHLEVLESLLSYKIISPISKLLACGDLGKSQKKADRAIENIYAQTFELLTDFCKKQVLELWQKSKPL